MEIKTLRGLIAEKGLTVTNIIGKIKMNRSTIYRKFKHPRTFTIVEVEELSKVLECDFIYLIELLLKQEKT